MSPLIPDASNDMYNWPEDNVEEVSSEFLITGKSKVEGEISTSNSIYNLYRTKQETFQYVEKLIKLFTKHGKNILVSYSNDLPMNWKDSDFHGQFDSGEWRKWGSQQWWWQWISTGKTIKPGCFPKYWLIGWWTGAEFYTSFQGPCLHNYKTLGVSYNV